MPEKLEFWIVGKDKFSKVGKAVGVSLRGLRTAGLAAAAGVTAVGGAMVAIVQSTATAGDEFQKMGIRLGVSAESLSAWSHAAELSGTNMQAVGVGLRTLAKRMNDANYGLETYTRSFAALGVQYKETDGSLRAVNQVMLDAADAISKMEDDTKAAALAQELFGRGGTELLPMLKQGADGIRAMEEEANKLGITFTQAAADLSAKFIDNMTRLRRVLTGVKNQIGTALMPVFIDLQKLFIGVGIKIVEFAKNNKQAMRDFAVGVIETIGYMAEKMAIGVGWMIDAWNGLKSAWLIIRVALNDLATAIYESLDFIADKLIWFFGVMEQVPLLGDKFQGLTNAVKSFQENNLVALQLVADDTERLLLKLAQQYESGPARVAIREFIDDFKAKMAELRETGTFEGMPAFLDPGKVEANAAAVQSQTKGAIDSLHNMYNEYFLSEEERLNEWYETQQELLAGQHEALLELEQLYQAKLLELQIKRADDETKAALDELKEKKKLDQKKLKQYTAFETQFSQIAQIFGKKGVIVAKLASVPRAFMSVYTGAAKALELPFPENLVAAATVIATGMGFVGQIKGAAHGGLENVPQEAPYLLAAGERVVSQEQNQDLTEFLAAQRGAAGINVETLLVEVMPNATNPQALLSIEEEDWREIVLDRILPALRNLKTEGYAI